MYPKTTEERIELLISFVRQVKDTICAEDLEAIIDTLKNIQENLDE